MSDAVPRFEWWPGEFTPKPVMVAVCQHDFGPGEDCFIDDGWHRVAGYGVVCLRCAEFSIPVAEIRDGVEILYAEGLLNHQASCPGRVTSGEEPQ